MPSFIFVLFFDFEGFKDWEAYAKTPPRVNIKESPRGFKVTIETPFWRLSAPGSGDNGNDELIFVKHRGN
jgi:hypothetical protein